MFNDLLNLSLEWLHQHTSYAWLLTLIISTSESIAIIGTIMPGTVTMTAIGALAGAGVIPLWSTIFWAFLGAVIGDGISYLLGYHFKARLVNIWPFKNNKNILHAGEKFFHRYGGLSVLIGRFVGPIRALIPMVAGMMGMKPWTFIWANVISGAGWALAYMLPGVILGAAALELPQNIAIKTVTIIILFPIFIWGIIWMCKSAIPAFSKKIISNYVKWCEAKNPFISGLAKFIQYHDPDKTKQQISLLFYMIITSTCFIILALYIKFNQSSSLIINQAIFHLFNSVATPTGKGIMIYITLLGQDMTVFLASSIIIFWLILRKNYRLAVYGALIVVSAFGSINLVKKLTLSLRPSTLFNVMNSYSFPSGHTGMATVFYGAILIAIHNSLGPKTRKLAIAIVISIILSVMCSRLYLGVHWFTDIIGGLLLGSSLLLGATILFNRKIMPISINYQQFILTIAVVFSIAYPFTCYMNVSKLQKYIEPSSKISQVRIITIHQWQNQHNDFLAEWNTKVLGFNSQAINLEWVGKLESIKQILQKNGWQDPSRRTWNDILFRLSGIKSTQHLPLLDPIYLRINADLVLVKKFPDTKKLLVIRLWPTDVKIKNTNHSLWVGVISEVPRTYSWLLDHYKTDVNINKNLIFSEYAQKIDIKYITLEEKSVPKKHQNKIMLIRDKR